MRRFVWANGISTTQRVAASGGGGQWYKQCGKSMQQSSTSSSRGDILGIFRALSAPHLVARPRARPSGKERLEALIASLRRGKMGRGAPLYLRRRRGAGWRDADVGASTGVGVSKHGLGSSLQSLAEDDEPLIKVLSGAHIWRMLDEFVIGGNAATSNCNRDARPAFPCWRPPR
jgi:hypothetical protein